LGRVLLEAQAKAKPVIAYDSGGMPEAFVPEKSGFLAEAGDTAALAGRLKLLLDSPMEGSRMGRAGRKFVLKHFSVSALVKRHEELYGRVLAGRRRARGGNPAG
jgi:glycosyltransferase involved in cell wall biosynthesis